MDIVLTGLQGIECFVYLDDIVIYASSIEDHSLKLENVFKRHRENNLKLQPDKCEFMRQEVTYLGHIIRNEGVKPNPEKNHIIHNFPTPTNAKEIKSFLGLVGYHRKFIKDFAHKTKPLTLLLKKNINFDRSTQQQESFNQLRGELLSEPILQYPDFSREFILTTDVSQVALGAVLSQGEIGKDLPIALNDP